MSSFAGVPTGPAGPGPTGPAGPGPAGPAGPGPGPGGPPPPSPTYGTGSPWPSRPGGPSAPGGPTGPGRAADDAIFAAAELLLADIQSPARRDPGSQVPSSAAVARAGGPGFTLPHPSGPPAFGTLPDGSPPFPGSPPTPPPQPQPGLSWLPALMAPMLLLVGSGYLAAWSSLYLP